jgi:hypothetical protein
MYDADHERYVPVGTPARGDIKLAVALNTRAYLRLLQSVRARLPSESVGALVGTIHAGDVAGERALMEIDEAVPISMVSAGLGVAPSREEWESLQTRLQAEGAEAGAESGRRRIVGWFYADPGIGIFPPRIDFAAVQADLASETDLFLLVNPASDSGAFYTVRDRAFVPLGGFYEVLDEAGA